MIKINRIIWKEAFVEKIESKHHVTMVEVEEILNGRRKIYRIAKGDVKGEEVYLALGRTSAGRYLSVFFIFKKNHSVLPISARDMDDKERRRYEHE
ncbi:MAG: BrnT family toxin [archaeon]|nr:BrnT family toxin [archaeon]